MAKKEKQTNTKNRKIKILAKDEPKKTLKVKEKPKVKELDLDKFGNLISIIADAKDVNALRPIFYKHLLKTLERNEVSKKYHILLIYEPNKSIDQGMADKIYNAIPENNDKPILLIIHNNGGRIEPAYLISKSCKELSSKFVVAIPRKAKSASTLITLGASEVHMGPMSELGPIDPQFGGLPALGIGSSLESIAKIVTKYPESSLMFAEYMKDKLDLRILGYFERVSESAKQYAIRLLNGKTLPASIESTAHKLVYEYKDHSFVIDKEESTELLGDIIKINSDEYKLSNDIHKFLTNVNLILEFIKKKNIAIIGSIRDFDISDVKEE